MAKSKAKRVRHADYKKSEQFVGDRMVDWLFRNGFGYNLRRVALHQKGVDIRVRSSRPPHTRYFVVEVKGGSSAHYASSADDGSFVAVLGQIVTRMTTFEPNYYGIAMPETSATIALRRIPWQAAKRLGLYIFSVDRNGNVVKHGWKDIKKRGML